MTAYAARPTATWSGVLVPPLSASLARAILGSSASRRSTARVSPPRIASTNRLFDEKFRPDVVEIDQSLERMIWRFVAKFAELSEAPLAVAPGLAYALMDGLFQHALLRYLGGDATATAALDENIRHVLPTLLA
jgi:hypothetical protein